MLDRPKQWRIALIILVGICAVSGVVGTVSLWQPILVERVEFLPPRVRSRLDAMRSYLPQGNLRVQVSVQKIDPSTGRSLPVQGFLLGEAGIGCPMIEIDNTALLPGWFHWCGERAVNLPTSTDAQGNATLWFVVSPSPYVAGLDYPMLPTIGFALPNGGALAIYPKIIFHDRWRVRLVLPRNE